MRVLCLVPSLSETLAECGVNLVGRTRFCIHPGRLKRVPVVGGTKDLDAAKLAELKPDLLILDKEENLPWMAENAPCKVHVFHATSVSSMPAELLKLAASLRTLDSQSLHNEVFLALENLAMRYDAVLERPRPTWIFDAIPGELGRLGKVKGGRPSIDCPAADGDKSGQIRTEFKSLVYVIWKDPWMRVSADTYIQSVLEEFGASVYVETSSPKKYPEFLLEDFDLATTYFLFSSEPFPFVKKRAELDAIPGLHASLVDGESYSWFGIRGLLFLENHK